MNQLPLNTQTSYDRVGQEYAARIYNELARKPFDRHVLNWFAERVAGMGMICDIGCGPGHVARYLHERGVPVCGMDLSPEMVAQARLLNAGIAFTQGDMRRLDVADEAWGGIVAFYSIIHIPRGEVVHVLCEFKRALRPGGALLLAFHRGEEIVHLDEWWDTPVNLDFVFFQPIEMCAYLREAGLSIEVMMERAPYVAAEHPSQRVYICAGKPLPAPD